MNMPNPTLPALCVAFLFTGGALAQNQAEPSIPVAEGASEPTYIGYGQHTSGAKVNNATDSDTFAFYGIVGEVVRIALRSYSNDLDPSIELYEPPFTPIALSGCSGPWNGTCGAELNITLTATGLHTIVISDSGSNNSGSYTMQLDRIPPVEIPRYIAPTATVYDSLGLPMDIDYFYFHGIQGNVVRISPRGNSNDLDPRFKVFAPSGDLIEDKSCSGPWNGTCAVAPFDLILTETGVYGIEVSDSGSNNTGNYEISLQCLLGPCPTSTWRAAGDGSEAVPGTNGTPRLAGQGLLNPGDTTRLNLVAGSPNTIPLLAVGLNAANLPVKGGILVPTCDIVSFDGLTDSYGNVALTDIWPANAASGQDIYFQYWMLDAAAVEGWAASNAVAVTTP